MPVIKNKICLVGFMGVGKSTFGKKLARCFNYKFVDTDKLISEQEHLSINEIFNKKGETYFRNKEKAILIDVLAMDEAVIIATGGGVGANEILMQLMKEQSIVVLLTLPLKAVFNRLLGSSSRPLLNNLSEKAFKNKITKLYNDRLPVYMLADVIIDAHYIKQLTKKDFECLLDDNSSYLLTKQAKEV